jgi:hypothetical protein
MKVIGSKSGVLPPPSMKNPPEQPERIKER